MEKYLAKIWKIWKIWKNTQQCTCREGRKAYQVRLGTGFRGQEFKKWTERRLRLHGGPQPLSRWKLKSIQLSSTRLHERLMMTQAKQVAASRQHVLSCTASSCQIKLSNWHLKLYGIKILNSLLNLAEQWFCQDSTVKGQESMTVLEIFLKPQLAQLGYCDCALWMLPWELHNSMM